MFKPFPYCDKSRIKHSLTHLTKKIYPNQSDLFDSIFIAMKISITAFLLILPYPGLAAPITQASDLSKRGWIPPSIKGTWANTKTAIKNPKVLKPFRDLQSIDSWWVRRLAESQRHSIETLGATAEALSAKAVAIIAKVPARATNSDEFAKAKDVYAQFLEIQKKAKVMDDTVVSKINQRQAELKKVHKSDEDLDATDYHSLDKKKASEIRAKNDEIARELTVLDDQVSVMKKERDAFLAHMKEMEDDIVKAAKNAELTFEHSNQIAKAKKAI